MDGWMDKWMDKWMDAWIHGWIHGSKGVPDRGTNDNTSSTSSSGIATIVVVTGSPTPSSAFRARDTQARIVLTKDRAAVEHTLCVWAGERSGLQRARARV